MLRLKPKFSLSTIASPVAFSKDSAKKLFTPFFLCKELDKRYTSLVIVTMIKVMIPFLVLTSLTQTTKDDGMSHLICSKAISGLVYDFKRSTSSPSPVKTLVKT